MPDSDRFERLNPDYANEHADHSSQPSSDRFSNLNPGHYSESNYAKPRSWRYQPAGKVSYWVVGILMALLLPMALYVNVILPMQKNKIQTSLHETNPEEVSQFAVSEKTTHHIRNQNHQSHKH